MDEKVKVKRLIDWNAKYVHVSVDALEEYTLSGCVENKFKYRIGSATVVKVISEKPL